MQLEPPDSHHLNAAQGWLELGDADEAVDELDLISPRMQSHQDVLEVRWQVYAKSQNWQRCVEVADALVKSAPKHVQGWIHRSYALHELKRTREALELLLPAVEKFPCDWLVQYNLSCYSCSLKNFDQALQFLDQACKLGDSKQIKAMALEDTDLRELRGRIG